jgi:bacillithiol biosynthesis cysteine-adding enzyme BshC
VSSSLSSSPDPRLAPPPDSRLVSSPIHRALDLREVPWSRPFGLAYADEFSRLAPFFAGDPARPEAWSGAIARATAGPHDRHAIVAVLERQVAARDAPAEARAAVGRLADPRAVAVVTGQQAGLFGGPLYTLLKAITTLQLARRTEAAHGIPVVPIFWVAGEDHDWLEVRTAAVLDSDFARREITLADPAGAGVQPVDALTIDSSIDAALAALDAALPATEFKADVLARLRRHYQPGVSVARAFACWIDDLLGAHGLVVFEGSDPAAKALVADIFAREMTDPSRSMKAVESACASLRSGGFDPQVEPAEDGTTLFYLDAAGRQAIKRAGNGLSISGRQRTTSDVAAEATAHPERFSPNVLLRSVVQDRLFPTICYVGGPAEIAYQAELGGVYAAHGVGRPLLCPRGSATIIDSAAAKFLDRPDVTFAALETPNEAFLNQLLAQQMPPALERTLEETAGLVRSHLDRVREILPAIDPTLAGAADTTRDRMLDSLKQLQGKAIQAAKRKDDTLRRQFLRTQALVFPGGHPQERDLCVAFFIARHGTGLVSRLLGALPDDGRGHSLVLG